MILRTNLPGTHGIPWLNTLGLTFGRSIFILTIVHGSRVELVVWVLHPATNSSGANGTPARSYFEKTTLVFLGS